MWLLVRVMTVMRSVVVMTDLGGDGRWS